VRPAALHSAPRAPPSTRAMHVQARLDLCTRAMRAPPRLAHASSSHCSALLCSALLCSARSSTRPSASCTMHAPGYMPGMMGKKPVPAKTCTSVIDGLKQIYFQKVGHPLWASMRGTMCPALWLCRGKGGASIPCVCVCAGGASLWSASFAACLHQRSAQGCTRTQAHPWSPACPLHTLRPTSPTPTPCTCNTAAAPAGGDIQVWPLLLAPHDGERL